MTDVLVDSNVLLDVFTEDSRWRSWSSGALEDVANEARLVVNPIIYGEVSARFERIEELEQTLPASAFVREAVPHEAAFLAGKAFVSYRD
jgi:hypothetical protein